MNYLSISELKKKGFKRIGKNVQISKNVNFYNFSGSIGSNCRIDDHTILIGNIDIGNYVHIAAFNLLSASKYKKKIKIYNYSGVGPRCYISCSTEDYLADDISNPTIGKKLRKNTINYCEPNTSDYILTYNEMASATFLSSSNKNLQCVECGAPKETKRLKNYLLQRAISRKRLKARSTAVFYVSTNLLANNNGFFPHYPPDHIRDRVETSLLKDVFPRLNKKVIYKYYPSQNYLYDKNPYVKLAEEIPNLVVSKEEDFRYIRTAADIILTSAPTSTLGWCIGAEKPIVYLDSPVFQPLENDLVSKVFDECFFVFNIDQQDWNERLLQFLNKSIDEIESRWQKKSIYREKYDPMYFLNKEKDAGAIGVNFIKSII